MSETFDYAAKRNTADRLITKFGTAAFLRRMVQSGPPHEPVSTPVDYPTKAARVEFTFKQIQAGNVLATDERWLVAAGPLTAAGITSVQTPDKVIVGGVERPILTAMPISPAGVVVMYDCHIRV